MGCRLWEIMNILWHIMPGRDRLVRSLIVDKPHEYVIELNAMYDFHIHKPMIFKILARIFSSDVARVIDVYLPQMYRDEYREDLRRSSRFHTGYGSIHSMSSSPHLAIDCVDPLPVMSAYYSRNNSVNAIDDLEINMIGPQLIMTI